MATTWRVTIENASSKDSHTIHPLIQERLDSLEQIFSNWRADSAISRWNATSSTEFQPVPKELAEVVAIALQMARETDGALDITIAPLIDLWGFGRQPRGESPPDEAAIRRAMEHCGWRKLEVQLEPPMLRKTDPALTINVSTLVEGYASDAIADLLQKLGHQQVLVDIGGAINARGRAWNIGIQQPNAQTGAAITMLPLRDECVTTAGTYRKGFASGDRTYSHIIDPATGRPVAHELVSVSVFAKRAVIADGYDTALLVLGPERGREVATKLGLNAVFVTTAR